jgi:hypothetical protein
MRPRRIIKRKPATELVEFQVLVQPQEPKQSESNNDSSVTSNSQNPPKDDISQVKIKIEM